MRPLEPYDREASIPTAQTIPSRWYTDPEIFALEQATIFRNNWLWTGRSELLAEPGSFLTQRLGREPLLLSRSKDMGLNALSNICRHRAARIETRPHGKADRFRCHYHNWSYNLAGEIAGRPEFPKNEGSKCRLPSFGVQEWGPLIFSRLGSEAPAFNDYIAPITQSAPALLEDRYQFHSRRSYRIKCNWKVFVDNYMDGGYHIKTVHPELARVVDDQNYQTITHPHSVLQLSPLTKTDSKSGGDALNQLRTGEAAQYWWLYPNLMFNIYEKAMDINIVLPIDANSCEVIFDFYFTEAMRAQHPEACRKSIEIADQVQSEDISICEEVQSNLQSDYFDTGPFCPKREAGGFLFHRLVAEGLAGKIAP